MPEAEQRKMVSRCSSLTGLDVDKAMKEHLLLTDRVMGLAGSSPFQDESFGLVTANMVVEHVDDCTALLADIYRILKPGGAFVFHTPNFRYYLIYLAYWIPDSLKGRIVWLLEQRCEDDLFVTRYHMNTVPCIQQMAEKAGFQVEEIRVVGSAGSFWRLGPLGTLECFILKALSILGGGKFRSNLLCALRKQTAIGPPALDRPGQANWECR
jgi:SAM-dependent methyltransferase